MIFAIKYFFKKFKQSFKNDALIQRIMARKFKYLLGDAKQNEAKRFENQLQTWKLQKYIFNLFTIFEGLLTFNFSL